MTQKQDIKVNQSHLSIVIKLFMIHLSLSLHQIVLNLIFDQNRPAMSTNGAHILLFPFPMPGHIIPILDLTHLLLTRGLTVTVLVTPPHLPLLQPILSLHPSSSIQPLVLSLPDSSAPSSQNRLLPIIRAMGELHNPILQWFKSHPNPPIAIVSDFFLGWTHNLARDLDVPRIVFSPSGAFAFSVFTSAWRDLPKSDDPSNENSLISFPKIPNCPTYPWRQMSHVYYREYREGDPDWDFFRKSMLDNLASWGLLFNSFTELERVYINHLKKELGHDRIWGIGPLLPPTDDLVGSTNRGGSSSVPPQKLMTWLDQRGDDSVVYVCFGTHFTVTKKQMEVLATALECSGVHFVWCVKPDDEEHLAVLGGFEDRVEGRGLLIRGWAPQVAILRHRAVGTFVTHCGWNSVLEGLVAGVMMLTWPMGADQFTNSMLLVDQLGVAVSANEGESVPDLAELTRLLIESVSGIRPESARVVKLRDEALKAIKGGSSSRDLDEFVKQLTQ